MRDVERNAASGFLSAKRGFFFFRVREPQRARIAPKIGTEDFPEKRSCRDEALPVNRTVKAGGALFFVWTQDRHPCRNTGTHCRYIHPPQVNVAGIQFQPCPDLELCVNVHRQKQTAVLHCVLNDRLPQVPPVVALLPAPGYASARLCGKLMYG